MPQGIVLLIGLLSIGVTTSGCSSAPQPSANRQPDYPLTLSAVAACPTPSPDPNRKILITAPCNDAKVAPRLFVEGVAVDSNAHVRVIVHPMETSDYSVQPDVTVREGGRWKVLCYFGEPGPQHSGRHYEVLAFVDPNETLKYGQLLSGWPSAQSKSQMVEVVRDSEITSTIE